MSINIPNKDQWQKMNEHLSNIAGALGTQIDVSTWEGVQKAVRAGVATELFPIGTQLKVNHSVYGERLYDVVAHDYFKSVHNEDAHTMTLMCHDPISLVQYDGSEAFYYADNELPAGTYNFTIDSAYGSWTTGTYQFTLTKALPKGGQLCINGDIGAAMTARKVNSYASRTTTEISESVAITLGNSGINLGTFGIELNHSHRVSSGSNNYKESAIRQFLNSSAEAGSVWTPQTKFDRPPDWASSVPGFTNGFDSDFLNIVGKVIVPCAANAIYESPDSTTVAGQKYTVADKFYLASQAEILGTFADTVVDDSTRFPYYEGAANIDCIKYGDGFAVYWWTRSVYPWFANIQRTINVEGGAYNLLPYGTANCVPVFTIV